LAVPRVFPRVVQRAVQMVVLWAALKVLCSVARSDGLLVALWAAAKVDKRAVMTAGLWAIQLVVRWVACWDGYSGVL